MSKAKARERKKKRLAQAHLAGKSPTPPVVEAQKHIPGKNDMQLNKGGKNNIGKNIPNLATSSRGAARSG